MFMTYPTNEIDIIQSYFDSPPSLSILLVVPDLWGGCLGERQVLEKPVDPSSKWTVYIVPITPSLGDPPPSLTGRGLDTTHQLPDTTPVAQQFGFFFHNTQTIPFPCYAYDCIVRGSLAPSCLPYTQVTKYKSVPLWLASSLVHTSRFFSSEGGFLRSSSVLNRLSLVMFGSDCS